MNILLFPSDEFGGQELPEAQIPAFVKGKGLPTDGGGCHLMAKVRVNGPEAEPAPHSEHAATFPSENRPEAQARHGAVPSERVPAGHAAHVPSPRPASA